MAISNNSALGKASGSAGVFTYRTVRGRTIASARVTSNKSRTSEQEKLRAGFTELQRLSKALKSIIPIGFDKTELGSARNNFFKQNTPYLDYVRKNGGVPRYSAPLHNLWLALNDGQFTEKVQVALGEDDIAATFSVDADGLPAVQVIHHRPYQAGDTLTFVLGVTYVYFGKRLSRLITFDKQLLEADLAALPNDMLASFDKASLPKLDYRTILPNEAGEVCIVAAVIITSPDGVRSTSYFSALSESPCVFTADNRTTYGKNSLSILTPSTVPFPAILTRHAIGATLDISGDNTHTFLVTAFIRDNDDKPIGFTLQNQQKFEYTPGVGQATLGRLTLRKDARPIALIDGIKAPVKI